jgi:hypothetical protein
MNTPEIEARHLDELRVLENILNERGYQTNLVEKSDQVPYSTLMVALEKDTQDRQREMALTFYPVSEEEIEHVMLLQYFIELPFEIQAGLQGMVADLLAYINARVVVGHFGITMGAAKIHFRYVQPFLRSEAVRKEAVADVFTLVNFTALLFSNLFEPAASGQISLEEARSLVDQQYAGG